MTTLTTSSALSRAKKTRFNPLTHLTAVSLARHLDAFEAGELRETALIWDALEQRDDLLRGVISKRKKSVARHGWTVLTVPGLREDQKAEAEAHAAALNFFYKNLECEHGVDAAERGGFKLLARQMMDAVGKRFAVHEIVWKECAAQGLCGMADANDAGTRGANRNFVTAKFRFVPLSFFENTTGKLRFLEKEGALVGRDLEPGAWMVTVGEGLMVASSTAWMFKHLSLDDWMRCSQRNGTPTVRGVSPALRDSAEWQALEQGIQGLLEGEALVHSTSEDVSVLNLMGGSTMPFPQLVERIDRMLAALWRGADLSTISRDRGYGASLQEKETCALEEDDAEMLTETLHRYVDEWVIRHVFGEAVPPLAGIKVLESPRECTTGDLQIDEFLLRHGAPLSLQETMSRYGRALPKAGEQVLVASASSLSPASLPENSQKSGTLIGHEHGDLENQGLGCGPSVSFRGCLPAEGASAGAQGEEKTAHVVSDMAGSDALPNQFTVLQEEWVQLSPYGDFPHARGLQRVDRAAADGMVAQFHSFRGRVGRLFGGVPFYVGHPDLPSSSELVDRKAYGWIMEVEAREDGFYGRVKWSDAGLELLRNAHYKFLSPFWEAREIGQENGRRIYRPIALISAGLTNQPNIPVRPLANTAKTANTANTQSEEGPLLVGDDVRSLSFNANSCSADFSLPPADDATHPTSPSSDLANGAPGQTHTEMHTQMHTVSCTGNLGARRGELVRMQNRRDRIQECVLTKMRLGMSYDEAWDSVKREHQGWFVSE